VGLGFHHLQKEVKLPNLTAMFKNKKRLSHHAVGGFSVLIIFGLLALGVSLGCSVGALVVQVETPTVGPNKTPQPTFTFTPFWTPTFTPTPVPTDTPSPVPTSTATPIPSPTTENTVEPALAAVEAAPPPAEPAAPPPPAEPTATPPPAEPAPAPTSAFPFNVVYYTHDTGSPGETRITGWIRLDIAPGQYKTLPNFQIRAVAPDSQVYLSDLSGPGTADSTVANAGDNHRMNTKLEVRPYTSGVYKIQLVEGGVQVSQEIEVNLSASPRQYVHFDFFKQQ
jgi:hypothetical protein